MKDENLKKSRRSLAGLIVSLSVLLFSVVFGTSSVFGWLISSENRVELSRTEHEVVSPFALAEYSVYSYVIENENTGDGAANEDAALNAISFPSYDKTFVSHNPYTSVFIKISFSAETIAPSGTVSLRINRNLSPTDPETNLPLADDSESEILESRCTSVMRFTVGINKSFIEIAEAQTGTDRITALYNAVNGLYYEQAKNGLVGDTFVTKSEGNGNVVYRKSGFLIFETPFVESDWNVDEFGNRETLNVYLYMSYDGELINDYLNQRLGVGPYNIEPIMNDLSELIVACTE